jgi:hypothetical protein
MPDRTAVMGGLYENASGIFILYACRDIAAMRLTKMNSRQFSLIKARKEPPLRQGNGRSPARGHFFRIHHGKEK